MHGVVDADVSLLGLSGLVCGQKQQFLLDSGASANFVSVDFLKDLGLEWDLVLKQQVRLADGKVLNTCGSIELAIEFGKFSYVGTFLVLQERVPAILGMTFFTKVQPCVNWRGKRVHVVCDGQRVALPVVKYGMKKNVASQRHVAMNARPGATLHANSFGELDVDVVNDCVDQVSNPVHDVRIAPSSLDASSTSSVVKSQKTISGHAKDACFKCRQCGKLLQDRVQKHCNKCANASFSHNMDQLRSVCGSEVSIDDVTDDVSRAADVEIVPLKQFVRGGQRQHYTNFGVVVLDTDKSDTSVNVDDVSRSMSEHYQNVSEQFGGVSECVKAFNIAQFKGLKSVSQSCKHCKCLHFDKGDSIECKLKLQCVVCGKQFDNCDSTGNTVSNPLAEVLNSCLVQQQLNFTHRHAHGGDDGVEAKHGSMSELAQSELSRLKKQFPSVFSTPQFPVQREDVVFEHAIPLVDEHASPPARRLYPLDAVELEELKQQIVTLLETNRIEPSNGPYGAPILFAKKKDGRLRMCIDYRMLNAQTKNDVFPLPRIDELLGQLNGATCFSKLDLRDGYHQIPMCYQDRQKTAFTCRYGTFQFTVMPFGLKTAPATFQRMMNQVFFELLDAGVVVYLDDVLIYSRDVASHRVLLDKVFALLAKHKLFLKDSKCHLYLERVPYLGHVVSSRGVDVESGKIDAVKNWPVPTNLQQLQQFLGLCNYYRKFVFRFSELAGPLTQLTRKDQPFVWTDSQQSAFDALKSCLCSAPTLRVFNRELKTRLTCDASSVCIGSVLEQQDPVTQAFHPVEYHSKRLSSAERNYSATDREFVAIRHSLERWRHFLVGIRFEILTDHASLIYLTQSKSVNRRNARWLDFLSQFDFEINHIRGKQNVVADALSRVPGSELLTSQELCSVHSTLNVTHVDDLPRRMQKQCDQKCNFSFLNGIISINEKETFRQQLLDEQAACQDSWFVALCSKANSGDTEFQYRNGLLCRLVSDHFCPVLPSRTSSTVQVVLHDLHSSALGGHVGRKKLLALVKKRFYWQNMYRSVNDFCRACVVCQKCKSSTVKPYGLLQPLENPSRCFDHISMDFVVGLPTSSRGFDGIFTIVDRFSRMVRFVPMNSDIDAQGVARLFFEHWICKFGVPSKIISDRDVKFQSAFWQSLVTQLGSRLAMSTSYHPQTDGLTERYHRSVEQLLRVYCSSQQQNWCTFLAQCEFALNASLSESHQLSPFEVVYGFVPQLPLDTLLPLHSNDAQNVVAARALVHTQVKAELARSAEAMKKAADGHRRPTSFAIGDRVWLSTRNLPLRQGARKLAERWTGPFTVDAQVAAEAWRLLLPRTWRIHPVFHSSQLKPALGAPRQVQPVALDEGQEPEYEVEAIVGRRVARGRQEYLVSWKGFGAFD